MSSASPLWLRLLPGAWLLAATALAAAPAAPFYLGADVSLVGPAPQHSPRLYQEGGRPDEEWAILMRHGWTAYRLRVFVSPVRNDSPNSSLENMIPLARRIKAAGGHLLLCLHLSDGWADPQHQRIPAAWSGLDFPALEAQVEAHTREVIQRLKDADAMPDWVQVGNEITRGTLWPLAQVKVPGSTEYNPPEPSDDAVQWDHLTRILKAGIRGVKAAGGDHPPRIAIHIDKGGNWPVTQWFFDHLAAAQVDYDIIAQSYYPPWHHGSLAGLQQNMHECAARYGKDFMVVETGYGRSAVPDNPDMLWPQTAAGRLQYLADVITTVQRAPRGVAVMYWQPEWDLWNEDGSPGPAVSVLEKLPSLAHGPDSHVPPPPAP